jgi:mRNA interferase MazF
MKRGDVVIIDFPFTSGSQSKVRPALVIQNDRENRQLAKTIVALITGNLQRASQPTHYLVDPASSEGASSNLHGKSVVSCIIYTIEQTGVLRTVGWLSSAAMARIDVCLCEALGLTTNRPSGKSTP